MSPALSGVFFAAEPPGKPQSSVFFDSVFENLPTYCYPQIGTRGILQPLPGTDRVEKDLTGTPTPHACMFPAKVRQGKALPSCFSSQTIIKRPFHWLVPSPFSLVILLFKMALKHGVEVLSGVPERKKAMLYPIKQIHV